MALPFVDERATDVAADGNDVWNALTATIESATSSRAASLYARAVGCADVANAGPRPLTVGSTYPGFRVSASVPGTSLTLAGRHRFARYELVFHLDALSGGRTLLRAETRAVFPGALGALYRSLVIRTGAHRWLTRRLVASVGRRALRATR